MKLDEMPTQSNFSHSKNLCANYRHSIDGNLESADVNQRDCWTKRKVYVVQTKFIDFSQDIKAIEYACICMVDSELIYIFLTKIILQL